MPHVNKSINRFRRALTTYQETSRQALVSITSFLPVLHGKMIVSLAGEPATCEELERRLAMKHQTVSAEISHLRDAGIVEDSGIRRPTQSGRMANVWTLSPGVS